MAKPKAKKGVMVSVVVKRKLEHDGEQYEEGDLLTLDQIHLQQLLDVGAVELEKDDAPATGESAAFGTGESDAPANQSSDN